MKTKAKTTVLVIIFTLSASLIYAKKAEVNIEKSNIEWLGKKIGGQHSGNISLKNGYLELKDDKIISGSFVVDMESITSTDIEDENYNRKLVGHLKSDDFFGTNKYPTAKFVIASGTKFNGNKATVTGYLTIKGKTVSITFDVIRTINQYTAKIEIDRSEFDVRYGSNSFFDNLGDKAINDIFTLNIKLEMN